MLCPLCHLVRKIQRLLRQAVLVTLLSVSRLYAQAPVHFDSIFQFTPNTEYYVTALAHDSMQGRATGSYGMWQAAKFIAGEMRKIGLRPVQGNDGYFQDYGKLSAEHPYAAINVVGALPGNGRSHEVVLFSAHYDHVGTGTANGTKDTIYNGANDNASGVALLLQLAHYYHYIRPERTVLFVAFSGEELGLLGSEYFARTTATSNVKAVFNFDMVGRSHRSNGVYITQSPRFDRVQQLNKTLTAYNAMLYGKKFFDENVPVIDMYRRSDHYSFTSRGIPGHTIVATPDTDPYYHKPGDEAHTIDFDFLNKLAQAMFIATVPVVQGTETVRK
ncbi:MAG: M28 family peptidase [Lacibacter sp.]